MIRSSATPLSDRLKIIFTPFTVTVSEGLFSESVPPNSTLSVSYDKDELIKSSSFEHGYYFSIHIIVIVVIIIDVSCLQREKLIA